jgi:hypothetical protein
MAINEDACVLKKRGFLRAAKAKDSSAKVRLRKNLSRGKSLFGGPQGVRKSCFNLSQNWRFFPVFARKAAQRSEL